MNRNEKKAILIILGVWIFLLLVIGLVISSIKLDKQSPPSSNEKEINEQPTSKPDKKCSFWKRKFFGHKGGFCWCGGWHWF